MGEKGNHNFYIGMLSYMEATIHMWQFKLKYIKIK